MTQRARLLSICTLLVALATGCGSGNISGDDDLDDAAAGEVDVNVADLDPFSFFVTSLESLQALSNSADGFGGDLRFGETGPGAGLRGADKICAAIAELSMPGAAAKGWHAFLSASDDGAGSQVNAADRLGDGPWYDRIGRLLAPTKADLIATRPLNGDATIADDFPNEFGVPNHRPDPSQPEVDNHDMLTGIDDQGRLYSATATCLDWTANTGDEAIEGQPRVGHAWPRTGPGGGGGPGDGHGGLDVGAHRGRLRARRQPARNRRTRSQRQHGGLGRRLRRLLLLRRRPPGVIGPQAIYGFLEALRPPSTNQ